MTTPILIGFDVEPDGLDIPRERRPWTGFERALEIVRPMRDRLATITGGPVNFGWYLRMDPQIGDVYGATDWVAQKYGAALSELRAGGDELGLHPHALRWDTGNDRWLTDTADEAWVEECIRVSFEAYQRSFGAACRSHRFGDRFISDSMVRVLRDLGVGVDMTLEPGRGADRHAGLSAPIPDQTSIPRVPYHPEPEDFARPLTEAPASDLWMFPLASADPDRALPPWRRVARRVRHAGKPLNRPLLLWAPWPSEVLWDIVARDVEAGQLTVLPFMIRVDTLLRPDWAAQFEAHMGALAHHPLKDRLSFTTPSAVIAGW